MVNIGTLLGLCDRINFGGWCCGIQIPPQPRPFPDAVGAVDSHPRRDLEQLHDVQAGNVELESGYLLGLPSVWWCISPIA